jgi:hypothetical protein
MHSRMVIGHPALGMGGGLAACTLVDDFDYCGFIAPATLACMLKKPSIPYYLVSMHSTQELENTHTQQQRQLSSLSEQQHVSSSSSRRDRETIAGNNCISSAVPACSNNRVS